MKFIAEEDEMTEEQKLKLFKEIIKDGAESVCLYAEFGNVEVVQ